MNDANSTAASLPLPLKPPSQMPAEELRVLTEFDRRCA